MIDIIDRLKSEKFFDFRDSVFDEIVEIFQRDTDTVVLTNDMGARGLDIMRRIDPCRVINVGITEQNMVSLASGLALSGKYVFVYGIISHVIFRAFEQIKLDICVQNLPVTIVGVGAGLAYGADGPTHHGTEDINAISSLPNIRVFNPSDDCSARHSMKYAYSLKVPCYIRIDKERLPRLYSTAPDLTQGFEIHGDKSEIVTIFCSGMTTWAGMQAKELLKEKHGINVMIIDLLCPKGYSMIKLQKYVQRSKFVYVLDEASEFGGISNLIARAICGSGHFTFEVISLPDAYISGSANREWAWEKFGMTPDIFCKKIIRNLQNDN